MVSGKSLVRGSTGQSIRINSKSRRNLDGIITADDETKIINSLKNSDSFKKQESNTGSTSVMGTDNEGKKSGLLNRREATSVQRPNANTERKEFKSNSIV